jgi:tetratricopeptide (TPR) repeat protein
MTASSNFKYFVPQHPKELVSLTSEEAEKLLLKNLADAKGERIDELWQLARFYATTKRHEPALQYLRQIMGATKDHELKAHCVLAMGQTMEQIADYPAAVRYYKEAFAMEPLQTRTWYFINNNLGFSLNTLGNFEQGEIYCRKAIETEPNLPNAYKNLGISLRGRGRYHEAAESFVAATRVNASDPRAFHLLTELLNEHPELRFDFEIECERCEQAVRVAAEANAQAQPIVHSGLKKQWILLKSRLRKFILGASHR